MKAKQILIAILLVFFTMTMSEAQDFDQYFCDTTLRADYIFAGVRGSEAIYVDGLHSMPRWHGRRIRLSELPVEGNGQIEMRDAASGTVIYRHSFSTLYQEWIDTEESTRANRSFENVFLMPMPRRTAEITITLFDSRRTEMAKLKHIVDPSDMMIRPIGYHKATPYETLHAAADSNRCIKIAFVAEGYTAGEMDKFVSDARRGTAAILSHSPFKERSEDINIVAVKSVSEESGTSIPHLNTWRNSVLGSHFNTFGMQRYLTTLQQKTLHNVVAGTPYEHLIVLVNTDNYGGGGIYNTYNLTASDNDNFDAVVVHEFGHSFAGLADEYAYGEEEADTYPTDIEPWEKNITTKADFASKWQHRMGEKTSQGTIGIIEGAGYRLHGVYRAMPDCRMRTNSCKGFCPVCVEAINNVIDFYVGKAYIVKKKTNY